MSRTDSFDYCDGDVVPEGLWLARLHRATQSKKGQERLREFARILDAMPEKRLIKDAIVTPTGEACFVGVVAKGLGCDVVAGKYWDEVGIQDTAELGKRAGIPWTLAWEMGRLNDDEWGNLSPEERWQAARKWIDEQLATPTPQ